MVKIKVPAQIGCHSSPEAVEPYPSKSAIKSFL